MTINAHTMIAPATNATICHIITHPSLLLPLRVVMQFFASILGMVSYVFLPYASSCLNDHGGVCEL